MIKYKVASLCAVAASLLTLPSLGVAGTVDTKDSKTTAAVEAPVDRRISGDVGVSFISQYISRGLVLNNQDAISQDYADLYVNLYESKTGFLNKVQFNLGIWTDLDPHSTQAGTTDGSLQNTNNPYWYEFDFLPGMTFTFAQYFTFTPSYYVFLSPSNAFRTFQGLNFNFGFDDSKFLGPFALHPSFTYLREIDNKAGDGKDQGNYFEFGITPTLPPLANITISFPMTVGLGSGEFYGNNDTFGYFTPGVQAGIPLKFIPAGYGTWNFTTFYKFYYLGDDLSKFNTANPTPGIADNSVRHPTHFEHVFSAGLTVNF